MIIGFEGKRVMPTCILCETKDNITYKAVWVDDSGKRVIFYSFCEDCANVLLSLSEADRQSINANIIEKRIDLFLSRPHQKISELQKNGFEFFF